MYRQPKDKVQLNFMNTVQYRKHLPQKPIWELLLKARHAHKKYVNPIYLIKVHKCTNRRTINNRKDDGN